MRGLRRCAGVLTVLLVLSCRAAFAGEPAPIPTFDMNQVQVRTWYLARYIPFSFLWVSVPPKDCTSQSTATFALPNSEGVRDMALVCQRANGSTTVLTKKIRRDPGNKNEGAFQINGRGWNQLFILDAKLAGAAPYFVMGGKEMLLIFASTPSLPSAVEEGIVARMKSMGYKADKGNLLPKSATP